MFGGPLWTGHIELLPARFGLVVWIGVLEVRGWFPIQLQHDPGVQSPNHQSKPAIKGKLRRLPKKGPRSRPWWVCQEQSKSDRARAGKTFFATQAPTYFIISYASKNVYSSHAKSVLPFSKHRSRDALRAGLVAIRSRQRVSERRSPEQGENGSAGCWPHKIHPHTQLLQAQAKCKQSRPDFAQSIGKNTTGRNNRPRLTASRILHSRPFLRKITAFPDIFGIFRENGSRNIRNISRKWRVATIFPKYLEYFGKLVPTKNDAAASSGLWPG